ncbi:MAG: DUF4374 domain-containing protein [Bacteroidia bacterium]|nr:DUF4374 domain-containing protein [Bacteroidia bacterium]
MKLFSSSWASLMACLTVFSITSCDDDTVSSSNTDSSTKSAYVVAATVDGTSYLLSTPSLDEGTLSVKGRGTEVISASYWVYKDENYLFGLVYNKGGNGTGASYYLDADGNIRERYTYEYNRITTYGTFGHNVVTVSTGNASSSMADADGNIPQMLLFNYLNANDGSQSSESIMSENFLGNGEKVHFSGLVEANGCLYTSVIPGGMSCYGVNKWPDMVTDPNLIASADGGSASSSYKAGEIPSTQYPDMAYVAIYSGSSFSEKPTIVSTDRMGNACGRMRSQYYQTIWAADNGDVYVFSSGYGRTAVSSADLNKVTGTLPSSVMRIKAGTKEFDDSYYVNLENLGSQHALYRCWHITGNTFLLQLYTGGVDEMLKGQYANVCELAIFNAVDQTITPVDGLPADLAGFGGEPYADNGSIYIAVSVTGGDFPAFYRIDPSTGKATKGLSVEADGLTSAGKLVVME